jgi:hypothetical protein
MLQLWSGGAVEYSAERDSVHDRGATASHRSNARVAEGDSSGTRPRLSPSQDIIPEALGTFVEPLRSDDKDYSVLKATHSAFYQTLREIR